MSRARDIDEPHDPDRADGPSVAPDLFADLPPGVEMATGTMLELLAVSDLSQTERQYTPLGGAMRGATGLALSVVLMPLLFLVIAMPAAALGRFDLSWVSTLAAFLAPEVILAFIALGLGYLSKPDPEDVAAPQLDDPWDIAFQCAARLAAHVPQGRQVRFAGNAPLRWAMATTLNGGSKLAARLDHDGQRLTLKSHLTLPGQETHLNERWWQRLSSGRWVDQDGQAHDDLPLAVSEALTRALTPAMLVSQSAQARLSLWSELDPLLVHRTCDGAPEVDAPDGFLAELTPRPEAEVVAPKVKRPQRVLWAGALSYWASTALIAAFWGGLAVSLLPQIWHTAALLEAGLMMAWPAIGAMMTLGMMWRGRPAMPRTRARALRVRAASALQLKDSVLHTGDTDNGVDLDRPFAVTLTREWRGSPQWSLLGVEVRQRRADIGRVVRFSVPVWRGAHLAELEPLRVAAPIVHPEDFRDKIWPLLHHRAEVLGHPMPWSVSDPDVLDESLAEMTSSALQWDDADGLEEHHDAFEAHPQDLADALRAELGDDPTPSATFPDPDRDADLAASPSADLDSQPQTQDLAVAAQVPAHVTRGVE